MRSSWESIARKRSFASFAASASALAASAWMRRIRSSASRWRIAFCASSFAFKAAKSPRLAEQIDKDIHFGAKHQRVDRFRQVVDGSDVIGKHGVLFLKVMRREKNDRDMLCASALLNQAGELNAAELRHLNIEDNGRELLTHQGEKCLAAALSLGDRVVSPLENAFKRKEITWIVIDNEDRRRRRGVGTSGVCVTDSRVRVLRVGAVEKDFAPPCGDVISRSSRDALRMSSIPTMNDVC